MHEAGRQAAHQRNTVLETVLGELAHDLEGGTASLPDAPNVPDAPRLPQVFVVGSPRSGTTLCYQWLAAGGGFTYPTNFVSRFPTAPWVGERVQRLLTDPDCDHGGELTDGLSTDPSPYASRLGKTRGLTAPHEFWYWWRRFLPEAETHALDTAALATVDTVRLRRELAVWESVRRRPLLMKALIANWNLPWLADALPRSLFVFVRRDPFFTMQSLLKARRDYFDDETAWYSFRPPTYADLATRDPLEQVAGQVHDTEAGVERGLAAIDESRWLVMDYGELCADPAGMHARLVEKMRVLGYELPAVYEGPAGFPVSDRVTVTAPRAEAMNRAWTWARERAGHPTPA